MHLALINIYKWNNYMERRRELLGRCWESYILAGLKQSNLVSFTL